MQSSCQHNPIGNPYCANGTTMTAAEVTTAIGAGKLIITHVSQAGQAVFQVNNTTGCSAPLIASSYKIFITQGQPGWLSTQQFIADSGVVTINANGSTNVTVAVASCMTQADLWYQSAPHQFTSDTADGYAGYTIYDGFITSGALCPTTTQCNDGIDNDNNGFIDYPNDPGCSSATDTTEAIQFPAMYMPQMPACTGNFGTATSISDPSKFAYGVNWDNTPEHYVVSPIPASNTSRLNFGNALDWYWVWAASPAYIEWDLNQSTTKVRVYPSQDHGPYPTNSTSMT